MISSCNLCNKEITEGEEWERELIYSHGDTPDMEQDAILCHGCAERMIVEDIHRWERMRREYLGGEAEK
jgi:hypothetical protein